MIILDTPPATWSADALQVAAAAEGVILVARSGHTRRHVVAEMVEDLRAEGLVPLGVVLLGTKRPVRRVRQHLEQLSSGVPASPALEAGTAEWSLPLDELAGVGRRQENGKAELDQGSTDELID